MEKIKKSMIAFFVAILFVLTAQSQNCPTPSVSVISTTSSSITIGWNQLSLTETYKVELYLASNNDLVQTNNNVTTNQYTFSELNPNTEYITKVSRKCGNEFSSPGVLQVKTLPVVNDEIIFFDKRSSPNPTTGLCDANCKFEKEITFFSGQTRRLNFNASQYLVLDITDGTDRYTLKMKYDPADDKVYICKDVSVQNGRAVFSIQTINNNSTIKVYKESVVNGVVNLEYAFGITNINGDMRRGTLNFDLVFYKKFILLTCITIIPKTINSSTTKFPSTVSQAETAYSIVVHPNPIQTVALVDFELMEDSPVSLVVRNIHGQAVITQKQILCVKGLNQIQIATDVLSKGIYFIELVTSNNRIIQKVVKQ